MPGYDRNRFVNLSQTEYEEFKCGICYDILKNAVVVPCCRHTYCLECIKQWLGNKPSCPNDRTPLEVCDLYKPQRLVQNLLNKLHIRCEFYSKGCQQVMPLESVSLHVLDCMFDPQRKCEECGIEIGDIHRHHCISSLKILNTKLNNEISALRNQVEKLNNQINLMRENTNEYYDHINEVLESARRKIRDPEIIYCSIPSVIRIKAIEKSREAIQLFNSYFEITTFLNSEFNCDRNYKWYAIAHARHCGESFVVNENGYIDLRFGQLRIAIFSAGVKGSPIASIN